MTQITSAVKHGGSPMVRASMAATGTGSLAFIDDFAADGNNRMSAEINRGIL